MPEPKPKPKEKSSLGLFGEDDDEGENDIFSFTGSKKAGYVFVKHPSDTTDQYC